MKFRLVRFFSLKQNDANLSKKAYLPSYRRIKINNLVVLHLFCLFSIYC